MKSLPQSRDESCVFCMKSFDTQNPCVIMERNDIEYSDLLVKLEYCKEDSNYTQGTKRSTGQYPRILIIDEDNNCGTSGRMDDNTNGRVTINIENTQSTCSCGWCMLF